MRMVGAQGPVEMPGGAFDARRAEHQAVLIDIGCGDGALPYRIAGSEPNLLCVGIDPNAESMQEYARRAARKPARGGRTNVLYVAASAEQLPSELAGSADLITINFPWAGLRESLLRGEQVVTTALQRLSASSARFQLLINVDESIPDLPSVSPDTLRDSVGQALTAAGFEIAEGDWLPESARVRSWWGGRLIAGSGRSVVRLAAIKGTPDQWGSNILDQVAGVDGG